MNKDDLCDLAVRFSAEHDVPVFPCTQNKKPTCKGGFTAASRDESIIKQLFSSGGAKLIGMPTGEATGIAVLDIDRAKKEGVADGFSWLEEYHDHLHATHRVRTQNGGLHLYFKHVLGLRSSASKIAPGIDVRAEGGYVIAAGEGYEVLDSMPFHSLPPFPSFLLNQNPTSKEAHKHPGCWHDEVLSWTAKEVVKGTSPEEILKKSHFFTLHGYTREETEADVKVMIQGALEKGFAKTSATIFEPLVYPLPKSKPLPKLPNECLPPSLAPWLMDVANRMDVPLEYVAGASLVTASSLIGRRAAIRPKEKDEWEEFGNLWGMLIAAPGEMKTPATAQALFPIKELERSERKKWAKAEKELNAMLNIKQEVERHLKKQLRSALEKDEGGNHSALEKEISDVHREILKLRKRIDKGGRRFLTNDSTTEKLAEICEANPYGILVSRDELSGWLAPLSKSGREGDREFYLEAWNGDGEHSYDRIGRGTLYVPHLCLSIFGTIQPGKVRGLVEPASSLSSGADGLIQRFQILLYPDQPDEKKWIDKTADSEAKSTYESIFKGLAAQAWAAKTVSLEKGFMQNGPEDSPYLVFSFDEEAQKVATDWFIALEGKIAKETFPAFRSHISKFRGLMPRLALNYFLIEASAGSIDSGVIPKPAVNYAIRWCEHLEAHARKLWTDELDPSLQPTKFLAARIEEKRVKEHMSTRDIQQSNWKGLKSVDSLELAINRLQSLGWLSVSVDKSNGGRPSQKIRLNPKLLDRLKTKSF